MATARSTAVAVAAAVCLSVVAGRPAAQNNAGGDEAERLLQQYVRIDTSNPPGNVAKAVDFLSSFFSREGIPVTRYESAPGRSILYARLKATKPSGAKAIVLLNHTDVVPADRARWKVDPFAGLIRDNEVWGRGALDMKAQATAELLAFARLKRERVPLSRDVIYLSHPDEEVGGELGARWMIANHFAELDPEYVIDEGGFGSRDLYATGKLVYAVAVAEKKLLWLKIHAEGVAGHGSQPNDQNPNDRLARALGRLLGQPLPTGDSPVLQTMKSRVGTFATNKFMNAVQHSTIAITWIRSGVGDPPKHNVIPSVAEAGLDCRVLPGVTRDAWVAEVKKRLGDPSLKVDVVNEGGEIVVSPYDTPLFRALESAIHRKHPDAIVMPTFIPYATDSNYFRPRGVKSYGMFPAIVPADEVAEMHGDAERAPLDGVREAAGIYFDALREMLR